MGSALITLSVMVAIYGVVTATTYGWVSTHTLGTIGIAIALFVFFMVLESRLANPIMPLRILKLRTLTGSAVIRGLLITGMFSTFQINVPQLYADIDRTKARQLNVRVTDIFDTMQIYLGSLYVNDFNKFGRTYTVRVQVSQVVVIEGIPFASRLSAVYSNRRRLDHTRCPIGPSRDAALYGRLVSNVDRQAIERQFLLCSGFLKLGALLLRTPHGKYAISGLRQQHRCRPAQSVRAPGD